MLLKEIYQKILGPEDRKEFLDKLKREIYEYRSEPLVLKSGKESHHYFDFRKLLLKPNSDPIKKKLLRDFSDLISSQKLEFDSITYAGAGGTTLGSDIRNILDIPGVIDRQKTKTHGAGKLLEGDVSSEMSTAIIDDVFTSGTSVMTSLESLKSSGMTPKAVFVLLNRSGEILVPGTNISIYSLFNMNDFGIIE